MSERERVDVLIVGGGVIGLSVAYELARAKKSVAVVDRGAMGRAASWAGAGMIAPPGSMRTDTPLSALRTFSARLHPIWARRLLRETGIDNGYRPSGGIEVAGTAAERDALVAKEALWAAEGVAYERLTPETLAACEPALDSGIGMATFLPGRAQVRNPRHLQVLEEACRRRGVGFWPFHAVEGFEGQGDRVTNVRAGGVLFQASEVVLAAGAWSAALGGMLGQPLDVRPVKGQIVLLEAEAGGPTRIIEWGKRYVVPRGDGLVLVGASEEDAGFDVTPSAAIDAELIEFATRVCPCLGEARVLRSWAGLRPGSADGLPLIGRMDGWSNVIAATGHHRMGLQLSTGTAQLVENLIEREAMPRWADAFDPSREPGLVEPGAFQS